MFASFSILLAMHEKPAKGFVKNPFAGYGLHTLLARVGEREKVLHYNKCEYCVCVCVCVFKVVIFWETTKEKALKDTEKFALFCPSCFCRYVNTFCFTRAKVENKLQIHKLSFYQFSILLAHAR